MQNPRISGIFYIKNTLQNKFYIDESYNIEFRIYQHLKDYTHRNSPLYKDMLQYDLNNFLFSIIEFCPQCLLDNELQKWTDLYRKKHFVYYHEHNYYKQNRFIISYKGKPHIVLKKYETNLENLLLYNDRKEWFSKIPLKDIPKECYSIPKFNLINSSK